MDFKLTYRELVEGDLLGCKEIMKLMMKSFVLFLLVSGVAFAGGECAEVEPAQSKWSVAAVGGTQGVGISVGYRMNEYVGFRLRGAYGERMQHALQTPVHHAGWRPD